MLYIVSSNYVLTKFFTMSPISYLRSLTLTPSFRTDGKIFEPKLRTGKQPVTDYYDGDDVNELEIKDGDNYYQCRKNCITKYDNSKCESCTVHENKVDRPVFCKGGTLPLPCMNKCCIEIEKPNERITGKQVRTYFHRLHVF